jgi:hypothetical protein
MKGGGCNGPVSFGDFRAARSTSMALWTVDVDLAAHSGTLSTLPADARVMSIARIAWKTRRPDPHRLVPQFGSRR